MKKVLDKALEKKIQSIIQGKKVSAEKAHDVVELFRKLQDASGLKVCMNVNPADLAYREVEDGPDAETD